MNMDMTWTHTLFVTIARVSKLGCEKHHLQKIKLCFTWQGLDFIGKRKSDSRYVIWSGHHGTSAQTKKIRHRKEDRESGLTNCK